ncbi:hypothetical protein CBR_g57072 [Chara braunii]|uniref:Uncharacterized protein n=1 Tax=Chara braunii TaxID=69332 RepID=A0A388K8D6_CHABU|nr:hypothetical protein CBR_g57072 [Chara braunii]|eukprot:GBG66193.1 hypothetical protein CBR_g57072 [Chara braunii]
MRLCAAMAAERGHAGLPGRTRGGAGAHGHTQGDDGGEIAQQVALITCDPIGALALPSSDAVFGRRACIFRPYLSEDDLDEELIPEAADDPALYIPHEIDETHDDPEDEETRTHTARRALDRADREMLGGDEDFWGPFGEVASMGDVRDDRVRGLHAGTSQTEARMASPTPMRPESSMPPPPAPSPAPSSPVSPHEPATAAVDTEELASSLLQHGLLQRLVVIRRLRLRSPSLGMLQEEGLPSTAPVVGEVAAAEGEVVATATVEGEVAAVEGEVAPMEEEIAAATEEEVASSTAVEGEVAAAKEETTAATQVPNEAMQRDGADNVEGGEAVEERLMQQFITEELDPVSSALVPHGNPPGRVTQDLAGFVAESVCRSGRVRQPYLSRAPTTGQSHVRHRYVHLRELSPSLRWVYPRRATEPHAKAFRMQLQRWSNRGRFSLAVA